jgi:hypothetical protein
MYRERVEFSCGDIVLEGVLALPEGSGPFGVVVVCHPHPLYGGNMDNNVVSAVCGGVEKQGLASFRFNFRGVGRSSGSFAQGIGECDDAGVAVSFVEQRVEINPGRIGICGYSFGSMVAFAVAVKDSRVLAVAGISPFVEPADLLNCYVKPKLFLSGTEDGYVNIGNLEKLVDALPEPKELVVFPGVDHFWWEQEGTIATKIGEFFGCNLSQ